MANHQINITKNGTKTLLTAGKYCDRDIDVNVNVPNESTGITPTGTKEITENGTYDVTNYASANVNVPLGLQPTKFTNVLDLDTTIVKPGYRTVTAGYTATSDGVAIVVRVTAGTHKIRLRGKWVWQWFALSSDQSTNNARTNTYFITGTPTDNAITGATAVYGAADLPPFGVDEYGDFYMEVTSSKAGYWGFTLRDVGKLYTQGTFSCDPIMTIDEPIGFVEV